MTTLSIQEFEETPCDAKKAAQRGPVFITERGLPQLVLLTADEYYRLAYQGKSIGDLLSCPEAAEIDLELPRREVEGFRPLDLD